MRALFLAIVLLAGTAVAAPQLVDAVPTTGSSYVAWLVRVEGGVASAGLGLSGGQQAEAFWYDGRAGVSWVRAAGVQVQEAGLGAEARDPTRASGGGFGFGLPPGDHLLVSASGHDVPARSSTHTLYLGEGAAILGRSMGPAKLVRDGDYEGDVSIVSLPFGLGGRSMHDARYPVAAQGLFHAYVIGTRASDATLRIGIETPTGEVEASEWCTGDGCAAYAHVAGLPPGGYALRVHENEDGPYGELFALVADVTPP